MSSITPITDKKVWEKFLSEFTDVSYPFFQTWQWGQVQQQLGFAVDRYGVLEENKLVGVFLIVHVRAKRGYYLHLRHGPVLFPFSQERFDQVILFVTNLGKEKGASFIRISPLIQAPSLSKIFLSHRGMRSAPVHNMDAEICWVLDISHSEEHLLAGMRKSHRYLVRKALEMDIQIIRTKNMSYMDEFNKLYTQLAIKKQFVQHKGIAEEFAVFGRADMEELYLAKYDNTIVSAAFIAYVGNTAIYRHSASLDAYRHIPASYLIQWEAIKQAKKRGKGWYNFWGIAPTEDRQHPWYGLSLFKMGFGGEKKEFLHAQDLPLTFSYWKTYAIEILTKMRKGY